MQTELIHYYVFVDFENVPSVDLSAINGHPVHVTLLIGKNQKKLDTSFSLQLHRYSGQIHPIEVGAAGHNALDLTLAYYLGLAVQRAPGAQFCIVSKDKDFEPMIGHLSGQGINVARYGDFHLLPFLRPPKPVIPPKSTPPTLPNPPEDRRAKVIARLRSPANRNRPSTLKALLAHIKTALGKEATDARAQEMVRELREKRALAIDANGKVSYMSARDAPAPPASARLSARSLSPFA
jgi:PIN domain